MRALLFATICCLACTVPDPKLKQYLAEGEQLYVLHCSNCHQRGGQGLARVYPPIAHSDYVQKNFDKVICGMKYGMAGELTVNGVAFNQFMPGVITLTELELAEIATYIYNSWGNERGLIEVSDIRPLLDSCARPRLRR